ncbi:MAG TPA: PPC domain-containing protein [Kofleriaceae bacterium]|jgi:hypothetical protein
MVRECVVLALLAVSSTGCELILDFSDSQIPIDATPDAPYTDDECAYKEPNDTVATAAAITPDDHGPAAICANDPEDLDFYKFTVPANTASVVVNIAFTNRQTGDLDLKLVDSSGLMVAQSRGVGDGETITCPAASPACAMLAPGDYAFEVFPALMGSVNSYEINLTITPM